MALGNQRRSARAELAVRQAVPSSTIRKKLAAFHALSGIPVTCECVGKTSHFGTGRCVGLRRLLRRLGESEE